ncbi:MAG: prepilin peptidase [Pseudobutyrivibrio sp.]|nr:prepilin peptidase [Pseudobutyrivibrio sp.]
MRYLILFLMLVFCSYTDIKGRYVKVLPVAGFGILGLVLGLMTKEISVSSMVAGLLTGAGILIFSILSKDKIGKGDALIIAVMGVYLGVWDTMSVLFVASVLGGIFGMIFIKRNGKDMGYELPFAPFLLFGLTLMIMTASVSSLVMA